MKKIFMLLIVLFILYFGFQVAFRYLDKGHTYEYTLNDDKKFEIKEVLTQNIEKEKNNYYFEIKVEDEIFSFQTYNIYSRATGIIKKIKYFSNSNYKCILPLLAKNEYITDMICKKDDVYYYYSSIRNNDPEVDNFADANIDFEVYKDDTDVIKKTSNFYVYNNLLENKYIAVDYYKGIYVVSKNSKYKKIEIFEKEKYNRPVSTQVNKYYLSADYDKDYEFNEFKLVNLENSKIEKITSDYIISFDSYIQGIINDEVYLFDKTNKKQYKIDVKNKVVYYIGNEKGIKIYKNGEFILENVYKAINEYITFDEYTTDNNIEIPDYNLFKVNGNKLSGYYLVYQKVNNVYKVYKVNVQNKDIITYLFTTTDINSIKCNNEYIFFKDSKEIKYFNDLIGVKTLLKYNELEFNNKLNFYVYSK